MVIFRADGFSEELNGVPRERELSENPEQQQGFSGEDEPPPPQTPH